MNKGYAFLIESLPLIIRVERRSVERWCDAKLKLYKTWKKNKVEENKKKELLVEYTSIGS